MFNTPPNRPYADIQREIDGLDRKFNGWSPASEKATRRLRREREAHPDRFKNTW